MSFDVATGQINDGYGSIMEGKFNPIAMLYADYGAGPGLVILACRGGFPPNPEVFWLSLDSPGKYRGLDALPL